MASERITDELLARWESLASKAAKGPWVRWSGHATVFAGNTTQNTPGCIAGAREVADLSDSDASMTEQVANARFIAASRDAVPALIARVRELEALLSAAHGELLHVDATMADRAKVAKRIEAAVPRVAAEQAAFEARMAAEESEDEDGQ